MILYLLIKSKKQNRNFLKKNRKTFKICFDILKSFYNICTA